MISYDDPASRVAAAVQRAWNSVRNASDRYMDDTIDSATGASGCPERSR